MAADREQYLRSRIFRLVVMILFLILFGHLFVMMVQDHEEYSGQALKNREVRRRIRAPRGKIFDRDGRELVKNEFTANITVPADCLKSDANDSTFSRLVNWFDLPLEATRERLLEQQERGRSRLVIIPDAPMRQVIKVEERSRELPGVKVEIRTRRRYLAGSLMAHIIGFVGEVGKADLDTTLDVSGYRVGDMIGKQGIEATYEKILRGSYGEELVEINASGRVVMPGKKTLNPVQPGSDLKLSLSLPLQVAMEEILGDRNGCMVALSTRTGEVLAAYSNPSFNPNRLTGSISPEEWNDLISDPNKPFFNRIVQATYPPASLYKPITSLVALKHGIVGRETFLEPCLGGWNFGNRYFRCWKYGGHGPVDHVEAMVQSCDTYYYQLGQELDIDQLAAGARAFGLGRTCSGIFAAEVAGNIPDSQWYDRRFGPGGWTRGVLLNNAIGQGEVLVTPLQMALLAARIATSGRVPDPIFVISPPQTVVHPDPLPFAEGDLAWCRRVMSEVVARGTGKAAALEDIPVAGKTGTGQNPHGEDHAWFMCFAPADEPLVALAVIVENAGHGSTQAAPLARRWLEAYFHPESENEANPEKMNRNGEGGPR